MAQPRFADVKAILDDIIAQWTVGNGAPPDLTGVHGGNFAWDTKQALLAAQARGNPLIQKEIIGVKGQGRNANIVIDLIAGLTVGVRRFPRMPLGGLDSTSRNYLDPQGPKIQTIVDWIEGGCPD